MKLFREKAGVFSEDARWVLFAGPYMYDAPTLAGLAWLAFREWKNDRHLIG